MSTHNINVTDLIHSFVAPFDKEFWSGVKALERLIPKDRWQVEKKSVLSKHKIDTDLLMLYDISETDFNREKQNILDQWQKSKQDACDRGTIIHKQLEDSFKGGKQTLEQFGLGGKFEFMNDYSDLDLPRGAYSEFSIRYEDGDFRLNGKVDLLVKDLNDIIVIDFKTNSKINKKAASYNQQTRTTQRMLYPLNKFDNCNFNEYQLQVSTYAWMLTKIKPELKVKELIIYHIDPTTGAGTMYKCDYLKDEVENMILYYRKKLKHEDTMKKMKPLIF